MSAATAGCLFLLACGGGEAGEETAGGETLDGSVEIDGSSTVFPVQEAVAEEFQIQHPDARVTVGISGTGGGFKRFCSGEIDIANASRPIRDSEREDCAENGVDFMELRVAWDGLSVVTTPRNDFVQCLTMEELRRIWEPDSNVETWQDVRPSWPDQEVQLYGPGVDSGTFDYFTEEVVGEAKASRTDFQASEDDNVLVEGVSGDPGSLGYFGYAYYAENQQRLRLLGVDAGEGCVTPSDRTIEDGSYPLARPLFVYVNEAALAEEPTVEAYMEFFMSHAGELVPPTGYHPLSEAQYQENLRMIEEAATSTSTSAY